MHMPSDPATRREGVWRLASAGNVSSGVTSPQQQDGATNPLSLGPPGWMGTSPWHRWAGRTAVWIYVHTSGLQNYLWRATEDKEEPMGRREVSACAQPRHARTSPLL